MTGLKTRILTKAERMLRTKKRIKKKTRAVLDQNKYYEKVQRILSKVDWSKYLKDRLAKA